MSTNSEGKPYPASPDQSRVNKGFEQWGGKLIIAFSLLHLSHDLAAGLLLALLPFIREDLGLNYLQSGLLVSAFAITAGLFQFLGGWLCDRMSRRKAIALGLAGVGLCSIAISFTNSFYPLLAILLTMGILSGFYHPAAVSALTNHYEEGRRGKVMALHQIGGSLGFVLGPLLGALIASRLNWHYAYAVIGLPALVTAFLVFTRLKISLDSNKSLSSVSCPNVNPKPGELLRVFKSVAVIMAISIALALISGPIMSFIPLFLVDVHHFSPTASSLLITVIRTGGMLGSIIGGWMSDKWGRLRALFVAMIFLGPAVFLLTKFPFGVILVLSCILSGLLMSMRETAMQIYLMDNSPAHLRATVFGIYFGFGQEGSSIIQPIAGDFMDTWGISKVFSLMSWMMIVLSILTLTYAIINAKKQRKA